MKLPFEPNGVRPPAPGEQKCFICKSCGHHFRAIPKPLPFLIKCPQCGSRNITRDITVTH